MDLANGWTDFQGTLPHQEIKVAFLSSSLQRGIQGLMSWSYLKNQQSPALPSFLFACSPLSLLDPCGFGEANAYGSHQYQSAVARMQLHPMLRS